MNDVRNEEEVVKCNHCNSVCDMSNYYQDKDENQKYCGNYCYLGFYALSQKFKMKTKQQPDFILKTTGSPLRLSIMKKDKGDFVPLRHDIKSLALRNSQVQKSYVFAMNHINQMEIRELSTENEREPIKGVSKWIEKDGLYVRLTIPPFTKDKAYPRFELAYKLHELVEESFVITIIIEPALSPDLVLKSLTSSSSDEHVLYLQEMMIGNYPGQLESINYSGRRVSSNIVKNPDFHSFSYKQKRVYVIVLDGNGDTDIVEEQLGGDLWVSSNKFADFYRDQNVIILTLPSREEYVKLAIYNTYKWKSTINGNDKVTTKVCAILVDYS
jgi:hypothetical protein